MFRVTRILRCARIVRRIESTKRRKVWKFLEVFFLSFFVNKGNFVVFYSSEGDTSERLRKNRRRNEK